MKRTALVVLHGSVRRLRFGIDEARIKMLRISAFGLISLKRQGFPIKAVFQNRCESLKGRLRSPSRQNVIESQYSNSPVMMSRLNGYDPLLTI
jgi:Ribonuclease G/E